MKDLLKYHIYEAVYASVLETEGNEALSRRLRAEIKSRFMNMSDEDLWELAFMTSYPGKPVEVVYQNYKQAREKIKSTA